MLDLLADNPLLKDALLLALFIGVVAAVYFTTMAITGRQLARQPAKEA